MSPVHARERTEPRRSAAVEKPGGRAQRPGRCCGVEPHGGGSALGTAVAEIRPRTGTAQRFALGGRPDRRRLPGKGSELRAAHAADGTSVGRCGVGGTAMH